MDTRAAPTGGDPWTCPECGWENAGGATCDRCGIAKAWVEDPPLDLPPPPGWWERPDGWLAALHAAGTIGGTLLALRPEWAPFLALAEPWQWIQVALSGAAAVSSVNRAVMSRRFHEVRLTMPAHARSDEPFDVELTLVPYRGIPNVTLRVDLVENTYQRPSGREGGVTLRSRRLARHHLQRAAPLRGRRTHHVVTTFLAPLPNPDVHDVMAELQASLLAPFAWLVPGLGQAARNLREHGGVRVRAVVAVGPFRHVIERRIIVFLDTGTTLLAG
jgi:hypothetical protein